MYIEGIDPWTPQRVGIWDYAKAKQGGVKFLGSYPAAGDHEGTARAHADQAWREADDWVAELRGQIG